MRRGAVVAIALLGGALLLALGLALARSPGHPSPPASVSSPGASGFDGAALPGNEPAPGFTLTDQHGRRYSLGEHRGQVTVVAFLYSTCGAPCIVIAQQIRGALDELRQPAAGVIVSADPAADTPASVDRFLQRVSLSARVSYLTGPPSRLRAIWHAYRVNPASAGLGAFARTATVLLLDRRGRERVLFGPEQLTPESLAHDIRELQRSSKAELGLIP